MCGISGYVGIHDPDVRLALTYGFGVGIDTRGGHAAGFVGKAGRRLHLARTLGTWDNASNRFFERAASCDMLVMHARYATCGNKSDVTHAHPFTVRQGNQALLHGVHNGMVYWGAEQSAREHGRTYTVDSRELLHLIALGHKDDLQRMSGYGVCAWVTPKSSDIHLLTLSHNADLVVASLVGGGHVFASTEQILRNGVDLSGRKIKCLYKDQTVGQVCTLEEKGYFTSPVDGYKFGYGSYYKGITSKYSRTLYGFGDDADDMWEEAMRSSTIAHTRVLQSLTGSENDASSECVAYSDPEDATSYAPESDSELGYDPVCESAWDPGWEAAYKRVMGGR